MFHRILNSRKHINQFYYCKITSVSVNQERVKNKYKVKMLLHKIGKIECLYFGMREKGYSKNIQFV